MIITSLNFSFFFYNATATTEIYTLSLHDALPIFITPTEGFIALLSRPTTLPMSEFQVKDERKRFKDRKSTRLNSSHVSISYAVFCLKKKKNKNTREKEKKKKKER